MTSVLNCRWWEGRERWEGLGGRPDDIDFVLWFERRKGIFRPINPLAGQFSSTAAPGELVVAGGGALSDI